VAACARCGDRTQTVDIPVDCMQLDTWTSSQQMLGRFTGSTSLQPLPRSELERGQAAWANNVRMDMLPRAPHAAGARQQSARG